MKYILALIVSPLIGLLLGAVMLNIRTTGGFGWFDGPVSRIDASLFYMRVFAIPAYAGMLFLGLPIHFVLKRMHWNKMYHYAVGGLITALAALGILNTILSSHHLSLWNQLFPYGIIHPGIVGMTIGVIFWLIAVKWLEEEF